MIFRARIQPQARTWLLPVSYVSRTSLVRGGSGNPEEMAIFLGFSRPLGRPDHERILFFAPSMAWRTCEERRMDHPEHADGLRNQFALSGLCRRCRGNARAASPGSTALTWAISKD